MLNQEDAPATKGDIISLRMDLEAKMASKNDLKGFATKDDLQTLTTEVRDFKRTVSIEHGKLTGQMQDFKEMVRSQLDNGISRMLKLAEDFSVQTQKVDRHQILTDHRVDLLEYRVKNLETPRP